MKDGTITELTHITPDMIPSFANADDEYIGIMVDDTMLEALNCWGKLKIEIKAKLEISQRLIGVDPLFNF